MGILSEDHSDNGIEFKNEGFFVSDNNSVRFIKYKYINRVILQGPGIRIETFNDGIMNVNCDKDLYLTIVKYWKEYYSNVPSKFLNAILP